MVKMRFLANNQEDMDMEVSKSQEQSFLRKERESISTASCRRKCGPEYKCKMFRCKKIANTAGSCMSPSECESDSKFTL